MKLLPFPTCFVLASGILKQIQMRVSKAFQQIIFGLKLYDLNYSDLLIGKFVFLYFESSRSYNNSSHTSFKELLPDLPHKKYLVGL